MDECKNRAPGSLEWKEEGERENFERWGASLPAGLDFEIEAEGKFYKDYVTCMAWEAWQARQPEIDALNREIGTLKANLSLSTYSKDLAWARVTMLRRDVAELKAENEELWKDAERYRWLRENKRVSLLVTFFGTGCINRNITEVDSAIDAAMTAPDTKGE